jgi:hypothetical protein
MPRPPRIQPIAIRTVNAGSQLQFQVVAHDVDEPNSSLQISFDGPSHGATLSSSGAFSWTPSWETAVETEFTFRIRAADNGAPVLAHSLEFKITVSPVSPQGLEVRGSYHVDTVYVEWQPLADATHYLLERREQNDAWTPINETTGTTYNDVPPTRGIVHEYRVRARNAAGQLTPFATAVPTRKAASLSPLPPVDAVAENTSNGVLLEWLPANGFEIQNAPITEYIVERLQTTAEGWIELDRGHPSSFDFDGTLYSYLDATATVGTFYRYALRAVTAASTSGMVQLWDFGQSIPAGWAAIDLHFHDTAITNPPQFFEISDQVEESLGYVIPLNNNFEEGNLDATGISVADNVADATSGHRVSQFDSQLHYVNLAFYSSLSGDIFEESPTGQQTTITFDFPSSIKLWRELPVVLEIVSGQAYEVDQFNGVFDLWVEGIEASDALRDVTLSVTVVPGSSPSTILEDQLRLTVVDLRAQVPGDLDADTGELFAYVPIAPYSTEFDGESATLNLLRDGTLVETQQATIEDGQVAVSFSIGKVAGQEYVVETAFRGLSNRSDVIEITAGQPHAIEAIASKTKYVADGTDVTTITATIRDEFGNLVADGTPVSWSIGFGVGTYTNGSTTAATQTSNGQATITLRAPRLPGVQHVFVSAGSAESELDIVAEAAEFQISGPTVLDLGVGSVNHSGMAAITGANVADGTPVFWTLSSGEIIGGEHDGRVYESTVQNGQSTIPVSASGPTARRGTAVITATIGGRLKYHQVEVMSSEAFEVEIERAVLAGDKTLDGVATVDFAKPNPTLAGQPVWGFGPPEQDWPQPRSANYYAETTVVIRGTPGERYYVSAPPSFHDRAEFLGLQSSGDILLDAALGIGMFTIRSKGTLAANNNNQFVPIEFTVREGTNNPNVGAPERTDRLTLVAHGVWARTTDFVGSFSGLTDPQTPTGVIGGVAGGILIIGDLGTIGKNSFRATPFSEEDIDYTETTLAFAGIGTEIFFIVGETADGPISAAKSLQAATRGTQLSKVLSLLIKRAESNAQEFAELGAKLGRFSLAMAKTDFGLQVARGVFTSEELLLAGMKAVDVFDNLGDEFIDALAKTGSTSGIGIGGAQKVVTLCSRLSGDALTYFKSLSPEQLAVALEHMGFVLAAGRIDVARLNRMLSNNQLFTAAYDRSQMLADLRVVADSEGVDNLAINLAIAAEDAWAKGRIYELQAAAKIIRENTGWKVTFVSKYTKEIDPNTGLRLDWTDVDFIVNDGLGNHIYYQAKTTAGAFGSSPFAAARETLRWIRLAQNDAVQSGVTSQIIKYVVPPDIAIPTSVQNVFADLAQNEQLIIEVVTVPLLR